MEPLEIEGTKTTPKVLFYPEEGVFEISGRSDPENVNEFYEPVLDWLEYYARTAIDTMIFNFSLEYYNSASSKIILDILHLLKNIQENDIDVLVNWHFDEEDESLAEEGSLYAEIAELPVKLVPHIDGLPL